MTDTNKWDDPWFLDLNVEYRMTWLYVLDKCNHAGIWKVNKKLAEFLLGSLIKWDDFIAASEGRITEFSGGQKWFISKFIEFQYGTLQEANRVHFSVIEELRREGLFKALNSPFIGAKDKDKDKDKAKDKAKDKVKEKEKEKEKGVKGEEISTEIDFWKSLQDNPAYQHIDFVSEGGKMDAWLSLTKNRGRKKSRQFVLSWINKIEKPLEIKNDKPGLDPKYQGVRDFLLSDSEGNYRKGNDDTDRDFSEDGKVAKGNV